MRQPDRLESLPLAALKPAKSNARTHSPKQIRQIAASIKEFGFTNPVLIDETQSILAGHGRVAAAKLIGMKDVPVVRIEHMTEAQKRAYVIADNQLAINAGWDEAILAIELSELAELDFDVSTIGFEMGFVDSIIGTLDLTDDNPEDDVPCPSAGPSVTQPGDVWKIGSHRLICGDALKAETYDRVLAGAHADLIFTDPPYNVPIAGHVSGLGKNKHGEFAMASGEMSSVQFEQFLRTVFGHLMRSSHNGSIHYVCMDWRHMGALLAAGEAAFDELKNLCVWNKTNGGMGTFYRSKHELVFVFKKGTAPHINNFGLGDSDRYRTNVWDYAGISSLGSDRAELQAIHPTVKPVAMIADAMRDCSDRGGFVLDVFGGSGSTLIAAQECGRRARLLELDPIYCDTIIRRWEALIGDQAVLADTNESCSTVQGQRANGARQGTQGEPALERAGSLLAGAVQ